MAEVIQGSVEILTDGGETSTGMVLQVMDVDLIPDGLAALRSMSGFEVLVEIDRSRYRSVDAAWTARTADGDDAIVLWREEQPFAAVVSGPATDVVPPPSATALAED